MDDWVIGGDLWAYKRVPPGPKAALLIVHGFGEHAGRHAALAEGLARRGIAVYAYDHRGHGRSPGRRAFVERFAHSVDDALAMRLRVAALHPDLPVVLLGVSMGGVIAVRSAQRAPDGLAGVVLIAPALALAGTSPVLRLLSVVLSQLAPGATVARLELDALSRDPAVVEAYRTDPLAHHGGVPARTAAELIAAAASALREAAVWTLPTLIVHGEADRIAAAAASRRFSLAARLADVQLRVVPGAYHEPLGEPGGAAIVEEIATWILARERRDAPAVRPKGASKRAYGWREGLAFGAAVNLVARLAGTNTGRYEKIVRPWFAPPGWAFPVVWSINSAASIWANLRVLKSPPSSDRSAYLRLWAAIWLLYISFGYAFFRRKSPLLGLLVTVNFLVLTLLSAERAVRIERRLWLGYVTLLPWLILASAVAGSVALRNPDPLLDGDEPS